MSLPSCPCGHEKFGYTVQGGVLRKTLCASLHQLHHPPAWGVQKRVWEFHRRQGRDTILLIEIYDQESDRTFRSSGVFFSANAIAIDRGFGEQLMLPLQLWDVQHGRVEQLALF